MSQAYPVLLVEDEPHIAEGLIFNLQAENYQVTHVENGEAALEHLESHNCALLILDLMLPGIDGLEVCRQLRAQQNNIPILMLTARSDEEDRIAGLSEGADDYLTKPFSLKEFLLRVSGMLRRSNWSQQSSEFPDKYIFGTNRINLEECLAITAHGKIELTELEVKCCRFFSVRRAGFSPGDNCSNRSGGWHPTRKPGLSTILLSACASILRLTRPGHSTF